MKIFIHLQDKLLTIIFNLFHNVLKVFSIFKIYKKKLNSNLGTLLTNAMWIRQFVNNHPLYKHDSVVNDQIQYDLMRLIQQMNNQLNFYDLLI